jgi:hypothetical protein
LPSYDFKLVFDGLGEMFFGDDVRLEIAVTLVSDGEVVIEDLPPLSFVFSWVG